MSTASDIADRAGMLRKRHEAAYTSRQRVRAILNGGVGAIQALLGNTVTDADLPWPNLMLSGLTRLAQKIGDTPVVTCPPPTTTDSERSRRRSEKKERIVEAYDSYDRMELQLPQVGRWLPGYGFCVWTIEQGISPDGDPYPRANLRDPFDAFPGDWGADQQPRELAIYRRISPTRLKEIYPSKAAQIDKLAAPTSVFDRVSGGGVLLGGGNWEGNSTTTAISVVEFYDHSGTWVVTSDGSILLDHIPNPLASAPCFVVAKRFAFDQLNGQYDHVIGLTAAMAKINILAIIAMEDAVFAPVNIAGEAPKPRYRQGRFAVNVVPPGTTITRDMANLPYQVFEEGNRVERQLRLVAGYPVSDDAQSPMSFATGKGLEELNTSITNEVYEYHKVLRHALQDLDSRRLEWDQALYGSRRKSLIGERRGNRFSETYSPASDIGGDYKTLRRYGVFAGFDKTESIIIGLQLLDARLLDPLSVQQSIVGLADLDLVQVNERIRDNDATQLLYTLLAGAAQQNDPRAIMAFVEMLPEGETKTIMRKFFTPQEPQMSPEEMMMAGQNQPPPGPPPDVMTALRRVSTEGGAVAGTQTVTRV